VWRASPVERAQATLTKAGAVVRLVGGRLGSVKTVDDDALEPDATFETLPSVLFDAAVIPDGAKAAQALAALGHTREFLRDQYRHCKAILMLGAGERVAAAAGLLVEDRGDWALVRELAAFVEAVGKHRNWDRASDPPGV
jgi:catalase